MAARVGEVIRVIDVIVVLTKCVVHNSSNSSGVYRSSSSSSGSNW